MLLEQRAPLTFGHPTPDAELHAVVERVRAALEDDRAVTTNHCGLALRGAADVATDVADVIFMDGGLTHLELLFEISRDLRRRVERSIWLTAVPNSLCITGALAGVFGLGSSLVLNNVFNLLAIGSTMVPQGDTPLTPPPPPA